MIATLMLAAVQAATPVPPTPPAATAKEDNTTIREIIIREHPAGKSDARQGKEQRREIRVVRRGAPSAGDRVMIEGCEGRALVDVDDTTSAPGKPADRTRVLVCAKDGTTDVTAVNRLREVAKRIKGDSNLSAEARNRVLVAINEAIAKLPVSE
jgi:hypothetical protein